MRRTTLSLLALAALTAGSASAQDKKKKEVPLPKDSFYALSTKTLDGKPADLKEYAGKVTLVVNLASK